MEPTVSAGNADDTARTLAAMLPPALAPIFSGPFIRSCRRYEEFISRLAIGVFRAAGLEAAAREPGRPEEIAARAGLEPQRALAPLDWILRRLAMLGVVRPSSQPAGGFQLSGPVPDLDPRSLRDEQSRDDPSWLPSYTLAETVAQDYPAFLRGQRSGEEVLFSPARLRLWMEFFSNDNGLYAVNNLVGTAAVEQWMPPGPLLALELGGGLGSAALALLERLRAAGRWPEFREYRFTELVPAFLRRGERALVTRWPDAAFLSFCPLDMNQPFAAQGVERASVGLVYAVNTLHVARDLAFTLGQVFQSLSPGGRLIISECVRPLPGQAIDVEFIFNLMETFRSPVLHPLYRPNGGFLTPELWHRALEAARFVDVRFIPDIRALRQRFPTFNVAAIATTRPP